MRAEEPPEPTALVMDREEVRAAARVVGGILLPRWDLRRVYAEEADGTPAAARRTANALADIMVCIVSLKLIKRCEEEMMRHPCLRVTGNKSNTLLCYFKSSVTWVTRGYYVNVFYLKHGLSICDGELCHHRGEDPPIL